MPIKHGCILLCILKLYWIKKDGYIPEFDGIRAIGAFLVMLSHWYPVAWVNQIGAGAIGVNMFFALSGFLICGIVRKMMSNSDVAKEKRMFPESYLQFILSRMIRLLPALVMFFLFVVLTADFLPSHFGNDWLWYITFTQNFKIFSDQSWPAGKISHLWTIAVEFQFYVLWPLIFGFIWFKNKWKNIVFLFVMFSAFSNYMVWRYGVFSDVLLPNSMPIFIAGAWAYCLKNYDFPKRILLKKITYVIGVFFAMLYVLECLDWVHSSLDIRVIFSFIMSALLLAIISDFRIPLLSLFLSSKPIVLIGKWSYVIYLFHNHIPFLLNQLLGYLKKQEVTLDWLPYMMRLSQQEFFFYFICFILLCVLAGTIHEFFEKPIIRWGKNKLASMSLNLSWR